MTFSFLGLLIGLQSDGQDNLRICQVGALLISYRARLYESPGKEGSVYHGQSSGGAEEFLPAFWLMTTSEEEYGQWPTMQSNYLTDYKIILAGKYRNASGKTFEVGVELIWTTSDPSILELTTVNGTVREDGSASRTYTVNFYPVQPLYLYLPEGIVTMDMGDSLTIDYSLDQPGSRPQDSKVYWKSLNEDVLTVADGVITAHKPGWAMMVGTLTSGYDDFMGVY